LRKDATMIPSRRLLNLRAFKLPVRMGGIGVLILLAALSLRGAQNPAPTKNGEILPPPAVNSQTGLTASQPQQEPGKPKRTKTQADAVELSALADQLRDQLNKMNVNVLSLDILHKTQAIEDLAKKIKAETHEPQN
jgi:hypothetical protein